MFSVTLFSRLDSDVAQAERADFGICLNKPPLSCGCEKVDVAEAIGDYEKIRAMTGTFWTVDNEAAFEVDVSTMSVDVDDAD